MSPSNKQLGPPLSKKPNATNASADKEREECKKGAINGLSDVTGAADMGTEGGGEKVSM